MVLHVITGGSNDWDLVSDPDEAWRVLTDWDVDYFMIFIAAQKLQGTPPLIFAKWRR